MAKLLNLTTTAIRGPGGAPVATVFGPPTLKATPSAAASAPAHLPLWAALLPLRARRLRHCSSHGANTCSAAPSGRSLRLLRCAAAQDRASGSAPCCGLGGNRREVCRRRGLGLLPGVSGRAGRSCSLALRRRSCRGRGSYRGTSTCTRQYPSASTRNPRVQARRCQNHAHQLMEAQR